MTFPLGKKKTTSGSKITNISNRTNTSGQLWETTNCTLLMLVHVHNNILDNINLADVANQTFISELFIRIVRLS